MHARDNFLFGFIERTCNALIARGYSSIEAHNMVMHSKLYTYMQSNERWAYTHDMDEDDWADWIEEDLGLKEQAIPLWQINMKAMGLR